ncbi:MAG: M14 family metallocarboxypeptidase [Clostridia bacterium]|nr:M14 family metallocarboxypeptidase [Clostridia bacterium]
MMDEFQITAPPDTCTVRALLEELQTRYPFLTVRTLGHSVLGRPIYALYLGEEHEPVLFAGAFHGMEWLTCALLLQFTADLCCALDTGGELAGIDVRRAWPGRGLVIVPCVNPDGVEIALHGAGAALHLQESVWQLSGGNPARWQANAHGVDLNHNFDAGWHTLRQMEQEAGITGPGPTRFGGTAPESEPETRLLTALCRSVPFRHAVAFHSQGEEIYGYYGASTPKKSALMARILALTSGYRVMEPEGLAAHGGFKDWFIRAFQRPGFTIEVGRGCNPLPLSDLPALRMRLREMMTLAALM